MLPDTSLVDLVSMPVQNTRWKSLYVWFHLRFFFLFFALFLYPFFIDDVKTAKVVLVCKTGRIAPSADRSMASLVSTGGKMQNEAEKAPAGTFPQKSRFRIIEIVLLCVAPKQESPAHRTRCAMSVGAISLNEPLFAVTLFFSLSRKGHFPAVLFLL